MTAQEKFQELQDRSKKLIEGSIQINTKIESAREAHEKLARDTNEKYGTSNVDDLIKMLASWEAENANEIKKYEESVNNLEKEVNEKSMLIKQIQQASA
jgi:hypothetical protein